MNKKILVIPAALVLLTSLASCNSSTNKGNLVYYEVDGGYCVSSLSNTHRDQITEIKVPEKINGKRVVEISKGAFKGCTKLETITLPFIGHRANADGIGGFFGYVFGDEMYEGGGAYTWQCYGLGDEYDDPATDYHGFVIPTTLRKVTITGGDYITPGAFSCCTNLREIYIEDGNKGTEISNYAFYNCIALKRFDIPEKITTIGRKAFEGCENLSEIIIPNEVKTIKHNAFSYCSSAIKAKIPQTVDNMGHYVFNDFKGLIMTDAVNDKSGWDTEWADSKASIVYNYHDAGMVYIDKAHLAICGQGDDQYLFLVQWLEKWKEPKLQIPGSATINGKTYKLKKIGPSVFSENIYIQELEIGEGIEDIGSRAFEKCRALTRVSLPASLKEIGTSAFEGCYNLNKGTNELMEEDPVISLKNVTKIGKAAFKDCYHLDEAGNACGIVHLDLGSKIEEIGDSAFEGCEALCDSYIPESGDNAEFIVPKTVKKIGENAFYKTFRHVANSNVEMNLTFEPINEGESCAIESIGKGAFSEMGVSARTKDLYPSEFTYTVKLNVDLSKLSNLKDKRIPDGMFKLSYLGTVENFPTDIYEVGDHAFYYAYGTSKVTKVELPTTITKIAPYAFCNAYYFELNFDSTFKETCNIKSIGEYGFSGCYSPCPLVDEKLYIPDSVETLGNYAFNNCAYVKEIHMEENTKITVLPSSCFSSCSALETGIVIPEQVHEIGSSAFSSCKTLPTIEFKGTIDKIGSSAFYNCSVLSQVNFKDNSLAECTSFGSSVYFGCAALTNPIYPTGLANISASTFDGCIAMQTFKIESAQTIKDYAFANCSELTTITGATAVSVIGVNAFAGCSKLSNIGVLADSTVLNGICDQAFLDCTKINEFTVSKFITTEWTGKIGMGVTPFKNWLSSQTINIHKNQVVYEGATPKSTYWGWTLTPDGSGHYTSKQSGGAATIKIID